jgi:hypothetical protein
MATITAAVLHFDDSATGQMHPNRREFDHTDELSKFLNSANQPSKKRLIVIQAPPATGCTTVSTVARSLHNAIQIPEIVFQSHIRKSNNPFRYSSNFMNPVMPTESGLHYAKTGWVSLPYYVLRWYQPDEWDAKSFVKNYRDPLTEEYELVCAETGQQIQVHESSCGSRGPLVIVPRKTTFWWRVNTQGGWDGMFE